MAAAGEVAKVKSEAKDRLVALHQEEFDGIVADLMQQRGFVPQTKTVWVTKQ